jgi:excisionase family DNA binding protein
MSIEELLVSIREGIEQGNRLLEQLVATPPKPDRGHLVPIKEAAEQLGVCHQTIRNRIATGEYPSYGAGTVIRVDVQEIRTIMARARAPKANGSHVLD